MNIPEPSELSCTQTKMPYILAADNAFSLKPYSRRGLTKEKCISNCRLSHARRISENAFSILADQFRLFMQPVTLISQKVESVVMAHVRLHNYLHTTWERRY